MSQKPSIVQVMHSVQLGLNPDITQALRNIVAVLAEAGAKLEHLTRLMWFVTSKAEYLASLKQIGQSYREIIGKHYPAMTLVQVVALVEERAKVEIEATAVIPT